MSNVVEKGFSISHEYDGTKIKHTLITTTIKEWGGDASTNYSFSSGDEDYGSVDAGGESFSNAKVVSKDTSYEGSQSFVTTVVEQKVDSNLDCDTFCGLKASQLQSFSDVTSTTEGKDKKVTSRKLSAQIADDDSLKSSPKSTTGTALLDKVISCMQGKLSEDTASCDGVTTVNRSENIDKGSCSVSMSQDISEDLTNCDKDCETTESTSVSYSDNGLVSISVSGDFKGAKEDYNCDAQGNKLSVKKTKYQYARGCYAGLDKDAKLLELYEEHQKEACETDVCLALRVQSESENHCEQDGSISWSISASEEEVKDPEDNNLKERDSTQKQGCITNTTRTFEMTLPVKDNTVVAQQPRYLRGDCSHVVDGGGLDAATVEAKISAALQQVNTAPPAGSFGPLSFSANINLSGGSLSGSMSFSDDPAYDTPDLGLVKKKIETVTVCPQEVNEDKRQIPCGAAAMNILSYGGPGSTQKCLDLEFYPCAKEQDVIAALNITAAGLVVEDSISVSVSDGSKSGSACKRWHTAADLRGKC